MDAGVDGRNENPNLESPSRLDQLLRCSSTEAWYRLIFEPMSSTFSRPKPWFDQRQNVRFVARGIFHFHLMIIAEADAEGKLN